MMLMDGWILFNFFLAYPLFCFFSSLFFWMFLVAFVAFALDTLICVLALGFYFWSKCKREVDVFI